MLEIDNYYKLKMKNIFCTGVLQNDIPDYVTYFKSDTDPHMWYCKFKRSYFFLQEWEIIEQIESAIKGGESGNRKGWIHIWIRGKPGYEIIKFGE